MHTTWAQKVEYMHAEAVKVDFYKTMLILIKKTSLKILSRKLD